MRTLYEFIIHHMQPFRPDGSRDQTTIPVRTCIKCFNIVDAFNHRLYSVDMGSAGGCHEYIGEECFLEMLRNKEQHCARCGKVWWDVAKLPEEYESENSQLQGNDVIMKDTTYGYTWQDSLLHQVKQVLEELSKKHTLNKD